MAARSMLAVSAGKYLSAASLDLLRLADLLNQPRLFHGSIAVRAFEIFAAKGHALGQYLEKGTRTGQPDLVSVHVAKKDGSF